MLKLILVCIPLLHNLSFYSCLYRFNLCIRISARIPFCDYGKLHSGLHPPFLRSFIRLLSLSFESVFVFPFCDEDKLHSGLRPFFCPFHSNLQSADTNDIGQTCKNCFRVKLDPNSHDDEDVGNDDAVGDGEDAGDRDDEYEVFMDGYEVIMEW